MGRLLHVIAGPFRSARLLGTGTLIGVSKEFAGPFFDPGAHHQGTGNGIRCSHAVVWV